MVLPPTSLRKIRPSVEPGEIPYAYEHIQTSIHPDFISSRESYLFSRSRQSTTTGALCASLPSTSWPKTLSLPSTSSLPCFLNLSHRVPFAELQNVTECMPYLWKQHRPPLAFLSLLQPIHCPCQVCQRTRICLLPSLSPLAPCVAKVLTPPPRQLPWQRLEVTS